MSATALIAGAILGISLVNVILQAWLGLTVLLTSARRSWGLWLTSGALLSGTGFFLAQAAVAGGGLRRIAFAMYLQWPLGWGIGLALPFAWYTTILWYAGFWDEPDTPLRRRHRRWFALTLGFGLAVVALVALALPYRWSSPGAFEPFARPAIGGVPVLAVGYPVFISLCVALALDVLRRPGPSSRLMGDLAHRRARPWLAAASVAMLLVSLLLGAAMMGLALGSPLHPTATFSDDKLVTAALADLLVSLVVTAAVVFLGQAIVAYEIFTDRPLPRHGLRRHWHSAIVLALGYGGLAAWSVAIEARAFTGLLLGSLLIAILYALFNWRSYSEREQHVAYLRPFVAGPQAYEALLEPDAPEPDAATPFGLLCTEALDAKLAYLVAVGPLSSLAGPPLAHPEGASPPADLAETAGRCTSPDTICLPVDPSDHAGAMWAVPLWGGRGLIGLLLLGEKTDDRVYTQEEMEVARAAGERLIDTLACARMAQRLMALQRRRLVESQVVDRRARRAIHDEVLPRLHAALLALSAEQQGAPGEALDQLSAAHRQLSELLREMPTSAAAEVARRGLIGVLRDALEDEFAEAFDGVGWELEPEAEGRIEGLPSLTAEVLFGAAREAIRNAARHGRGDKPKRPLRLRVAMSWGDGLEIVTEDDGVGFDPTQAAGPGHGVALHSTMMAVIGGSWVTEAVPGKSTRVTLSLPETAC